MPTENPRYILRPSAGQELCLLYTIHEKRVDVLDWGTFEDLRARYPDAIDTSAFGARKPDSGKDEKQDEQ